ncbi:MAG: O-antigen ligase family protein [Clostridia bacterium]|jgi:hypothetical protein|nr:O-antigen ligase family protein [Clostridia bacterium]MBT7121830.1 O-antigen ligase family protein [Clostridia bacterium]
MNEISSANTKTMSKIWEILKKALTDSFGVKLYFVIITGLAEVPYLSQYFVGTIKYGLIWALLVLVVDFFTERRFFKTKNILLFVLMLLSYIVTIILNYSVALTSNVLNYCYMILIFLVFYPQPKGADKKTIARKQMYILNYVLVVMITAMSIVGLIMFVMQFRELIEFNGLRFKVGFIDGRLTGIYRNAIYPTAAIGIIAAVMQLVMRKLKGSKSKWITALLCLSIVINYWHVALSDSRGIIIGLAVFLFAFALLALLQKLKEKQKLNTTARTILSLALAAVLTVAFYYSTILTRKYSAYIPALVNTTQTAQTAESAQAAQSSQTDVPSQTAQTPQPPALTPIDMERYAAPDTYGVFTGRTLYWKYALDEVPKNPLFGTGPFYHSTLDTKIEGLFEKFSHFHNVFVHTLVALGIVGLLPFVLILALSLWLIIRFLIKSKNSKEYLMIAALLSFLAFLLTINLSDTTILLIIKQSGFIFWIYLGYTMVFADSGKPFIFNKPFIALDNKLSERARTHKSKTNEADE